MAAPLSCPGRNPAEVQERCVLLVVEGANTPRQGAGARRPPARRPERESSGRGCRDAKVLASGRRGTIAPRRAPRAKRLGQGSKGHEGPLVDGRVQARLVGAKGETLAVSRGRASGRFPGVNAGSGGMQREGEAPPLPSVRDPRTWLARRLNRLLQDSTGRFGVGDFAASQRLATPA